MPRIIRAVLRHIGIFMKNGYLLSPLSFHSRHEGSLFEPTQHGRVTAGMLAALVLSAALGGGGTWWWGKRASGAGDGAVTATAPAPSGAASAPAGGASSPAGRRFGGANRVQPVTVAAVQTRDIRVVINAIGNMAALNTAIVRAKVDGELKAIKFKEGQPVRAGQVLAELDTRSYDVALAQVQGQLSRDQAQLRNAQLDLERYKDLLAKDSIAKQQVDTQDALVKQLQGTVQTDQAQVDNAKLQLSHTKVVAPISGRLGLKQVDLGSIVRSSDANGVVTITQTQPIALVFAVPEANLVQINRKLKGKDPLMVEVWDRELRNSLGQGKVTTTDNVIDMTTGTIKLKAEFANADGSLFPNQFANVRLAVDTLKDATTVPTSAVQRGAQGTFVYVAREDGTVSMKRIRLGTTDGDWVSVQGDLSPGEKVVTDGADRLREGAKVEVIVAPPARGGAGMGRPGKPEAAEAKPAEKATEKPTDKSAEKPSSKASETAPSPAKPVPSAPSAEANAGAMPPWFDRLPPEVQERFKKMNPDERREFIEKLKERRRQREAEGS
jgi:multidrug efflux system membrane fusion protein